MPDAPSFFWDQLQGEKHLLAMPNAEHTMMVTLVGQQIMRGRLMSEAVQPEDWLHYTIALLVHDIGYVRCVIEGPGNHAGWSRHDQPVLRFGAASGDGSRRPGR